VSGRGRTRQRQQQGREGRPRRNGTQAPPPIPLTEAGVPAATPGAAAPSGTVLVSAHSRARYPWLPRAVIVGSVWRGPAHEKVKVDGQGEASPWPARRP
jgi:hypothetical protein